MLGALNFYAERPHVFGDDAHDIGVVFAANVALVSRDVIGQNSNVRLAEVASQLIEAEHPRPNG